MNISHGAERRRAFALQYTAKVTVKLDLIYHSHTQTSTRAHTGVLYNTDSEIQTLQREKKHETTCDLFLLFTSQLLKSEYKQNTFVKLQCM